MTRPSNRIWQSYRIRQRTRTVCFVARCLIKILCSHINCYCPLLITESSQWETALARADTNSDGAVTVEAFKKVAKSRGVNLGSYATRFVRRLFNVADRNNHGDRKSTRLN